MRNERGGSSPPSQEGADWTTYLLDLVSSAAAVLLVGALLFAVSGVWPPLVAVESKSMTPHMKVGDLVFVMEEERFAAAPAHDGTGVVTAKMGRRAGYTRFGRAGDVIVYEPNGNERRTPIIHRAMFWVSEGENWYDEANQNYLAGAESCAQLQYCPAKHSGFITKGDANPHYDQVGGTLSSPVKPEWVVGTAEVRIPYLGFVRLSGASATPPTVSPSTVSPSTVGPAPTGDIARAPNHNWTAPRTNATG